MSFDTKFDAAFDAPTDPVRRLITALRSLAEPSANAPQGASQSLPEGFEWDFRYGPTCAIGLACQLEIANTLSPIDLYRALRIPFDAPYNPFSTATNGTGLVPLYGVPARDVTPAMVADKLEALIGEG